MQVEAGQAGAHGRAAVTVSTEQWGGEEASKKQSPDGTSSMREAGWLA